MQTRGHMNKLMTCIAVVTVACILLAGMGGYAVAVSNTRKVPIYGVDRTDKVVSISFDAAWGADKTKSIMDICEQYNVKATFFLVGFWMEKYPDMVKEIAERGFEIGTHTMTHPQMSKQSQSKITSELQQSMDMITELTGKKVELFRPPFGDYNNTVIDTASQLGLYTIQWSVDSLDWKGLSGKQIAERMANLKSGDIILCHNNSDHILEALPLIFATAQLKGLSFVPIGELIYKDNYTIDNSGVQHSVQS